MKIKRKNFPVIKFNRGSFAKGLAVLDIADHELTRLDFYEGGFNYELIKSDIAVDACLNNKTPLLTSFLYETSKLYNSSDMLC